MEKLTAQRRNIAKKPAKASKEKSGRRWFGFFWRLFLLLTGVGLGLLTPWTLYLNHQVTTEFEGRKWDLPSRVYARSLELYPGLTISPVDLETELKAAGYRKTDQTPKPGSYQVSGRQFEIHRRAFRFAEGEESARHLKLRLDSGVIGALSDADSGNSIDLLRMEPAEIASIYPLHQEDRSLVRLEDAPPLLVMGLQAVEDRNFKTHPGLDFRGIARAAFANLRAGKTVQGGSTLTQQLVKNYFLNDDRTLIRKLNEAIMAVSLEWHYDKAEILEAYLNEVYLGQQGSLSIHGFGRASTFYFGQPLERLEPQHIALLVGMVRGASMYNPRRNPERALQRRNLVLGMFAETGILTEAEAEQAASQPLDVTAEPQSGHARYNAFIELVRDHLAQVYREEDLKTEGLRIFTTLSPSEQEKAQRAVTDGLKQLQEAGLPPELQGAMVLADVSSGEIRALVGDRYPGREGFNRALRARRQIGSVIKPLVYLLALEYPASFNLLTLIEDEPVVLRQADGSNWSPQNYDNRSHGTISLLDALANSYNQATVQLGLKVGVKQLLLKLEQLGISTDVMPVPSVFLGAVELTPLEVTQIYQSLAAGGYSVPLRAVTAVQTQQGGELVRYPLRLMPQPNREAIGVLNYALTQVVERGTAKALPGLLGSEIAIAGKTGTTNDKRDSWFVGYTRDRIGVAWVGRDDNQPARVTGSNAAMRVWARLFRELPLEPVDLRMPDGAYWLWVDAVESAVTDENCPGAGQVPFVSGSEPERVSTCLAALNEKDDKSFWKKWAGRKD
ncbi:MAG: penicillin-binding protein 1B [Xanthomonadales bacterium]|nr:penicillin-binding protein 1B [Xanthomonadales bacterium]